MSCENHSDETGTLHVKPRRTEWYFHCVTCISLGTTC